MTHTTLRPARLHEIDAIRALFADEVSAGRMLPRSAADIRASLDDWIVADDGGRVVGCVSLVTFNARLGEVRSLYVAPDHRGNGLALDLIGAAVRLADERGLRRVLTLTRAVRLFERAGFRRDAVSNFPEKVWRDCAPCPLRHRCDEVALVLALTPNSHTETDSHPL